MILRLFRRTPPVDTIACLYGTIVAQARTRAFYRVYGVPDTVNGRLEMIMLHAVLILQRLEREPATVRALGQGIFDRFCRDMIGRGGLWTKEEITLMADYLGTDFGPNAKPATQTR